MTSSGSTSASAQALGFVARRLAAEPVGLVFAARVPGDELAGLPELVVEGLREDDARALLDSALPGPLDARVRDRIVAETRGNPLALLELPRGLTPAELAGGFGLPGAVPLSGRIEESFRRQLEALPAETRRLLLLAAADPVGDPVLVWRAAGRLGDPVSGGDAGGRGRAGRVRRPGAVPASAGALGGLPVGVAAGAAGGARARWPRSPTRQLDPDRRAWHRAQAAPGPDEDVAAELERSAGRAQARGGPGRGGRVPRARGDADARPGAPCASALLAAARAKRDAGALDEALELLVAVEAGPLDELPARRGGAACAGRSRSISDAAATPPGCCSARPGGSSRSTPTWPARRYLEALGGRDLVAGDLAQPRRRAGGGRGRARRAARPGPAAAVDVLLDALALRLTEGYAAAAPTLTRALELLLALDVSRRRSRPLALARGWTSQRHRRHRAVGRRVLARPGRRQVAARPRQRARSSSCRSRSTSLATTPHARRRAAPRRRC